MVLAVHIISDMDSQDLAGPICHPPIATASFSSIPSAAEVVVKLIL
jgi:hypothetical protein